MYGALGRTYPLCPLPTPPSVRYLSFIPFSPTIFSLESFPLSKIDKISEMSRSIDGVLISGSLARIRLEFDWNRDWNSTGIGLEFDWNSTGIGPERDARLFGGVCTNRVWGSLCQLPHHLYRKRARGEASKLPLITPSERTHHLYRKRARGEASKRPLIIPGHITDYTAKTLQMSSVTLATVDATPCTVSEPASVGALAEHATRETTGQRDRSTPARQRVVTRNTPRGGTNRPSKVKARGTVSC